MAHLDGWNYQGKISDPFFFIRLIPVPCNNPGLALCGDMMNRVIKRTRTFTRH
jgi:hypothetical protein